MILQTWILGILMGIGLLMLGLSIKDVAKIIKEGRNENTNFRKI